MTMPRTSTTLSAAFVLLALTSSSAIAQSRTAIDPRFQPWVGCWAAVTGEQGAVVQSPAAPSDARPTRACVVPSNTVSGGVDLQL